MASSTVGKVEREATLQRGEVLELGPYRLRFVGLGAREQPTHLLVTAEVEVLDNGRRVATLQPGQRFYPTSPSPFASVDVRYGLAKDLYVILGSFDRQGQWATFRVQLHPMIAWVWLGGVVVVLGGLVALWPSVRQILATMPSAERELPSADPEYRSEGLRGLPAPPEVRQQAGRG